MVDQYRPSKLQTAERLLGVEQAVAVLRRELEEPSIRNLLMTEVPVIFLDHLTETQAKAYMLADNKLTDRSVFDEPKLAVQLKELSDLALEFDIEATGFEAPEIDFRIQSLEQNVGDSDDQFELSPGPAVSATRRSAKLSRER
jgi:hypothetical protein